MAGLYIKGMEMPKDKWGYTEIQIWGDGLITTREGKMLTWGKYAIEVPDHGDLIDRDALFQEGEADVCEDCGYIAVHGYSANQISKQTVIIPADKEDVKE